MTLCTTVEHTQKTGLEDSSPYPGFHAFSGLLDAVSHPCNMLDLLYSFFLLCVRKGFPECIYFYEYLEMHFHKCILNMNFRGIYHLFFFFFTLVYFYIA